MTFDFSCVILKKRKLEVPYEFLRKENYQGRRDLL